LIALRCSRLRCLRPEWTDGPACVHDVSLEFEEARLHAITGAPRSGKTLLLHVLGLLEEPDFGGVELFGEPVSPAPDDLRREIRNTVFGYVFASPCLVPAFTVAENVAMPLFRFSNADEDAAHRRVAALLERFGIEHLANEASSALDLDTQFLVALARALVHRPRILLLAAPTRPSALAVPVRALVDDLRVTVLWSGQQGEWTSLCDHEYRLERGLLEGTPIP
jgi:ABC-type lipoprotein export system ATPase subunit